MRETLDRPEKIVNETLAFSQMLLRARNVIKRKTRKQVAFELGIHESVLGNWEYGKVFPPETKLPDIAEVYGLDLNDCLRVYTSSKEVKQKDVETRKSLNKVIHGHTETETFRGGIAKTKDLLRSNPD